MPTPRNLGVVTAPLEKDHQIALFEWMALVRVPVMRDGNPLAHEWLPLSDIAFAVPNGLKLAGTAKQRGQYMASLKKQGFKPGVSDVVLPYPTEQHPGLFLELKRDSKSEVTDDQKTWRLLMDRLGYRAEIVAGFDAARAVVLDYVGEWHRTVSAPGGAKFMI